MYAPQQIVRYCTHYQPQSDGTCKQTVYKVLISNVVDGRSLYREICSFDSFRSRELKRAYPNKHRSIQWTSVDREDEWHQLMEGNRRVGLPVPDVIDVAPTWWDFLKRINYDKRTKKYLD